jgi:hypothetical protein
VCVFREEHNHTLITSPSKKRNLRSQKGIPLEVTQTVRELSAQNVGPSQILEYVATLYGGKQNLPFKKQDVINLIAAENRKLIGVDVNTTLLYFRRQTKPSGLEKLHSI